MRTILFAALTLLAPAASALEFTNAWIREAPPGAVVLAGYAAIRNDSSEDVTLVSAHSDAFGEVEFHEMSMAGGVMKMRGLDALTIPAGTVATLEPGATHLMLTGPKSAPKAGDTIEVSFVDAAGRTTRVAFVVQRNSARAAD